MLQWINTNFSISPSNEKYTNITPQITPKVVPKQDIQLLPKDLSGKILQLQFLCEGPQVTKDLIAILIEQYTKAIEYYEEIDSNKFLIYKKRMEHFLKKPKVDDILRGKSVRLITIKDNAQKQIHSALNKSKLQVKKLMKQCQKKADSSNQIVFKNMQLQEKSLHNRIERRRTRSNRFSNSAERDSKDQYSAKKQNREATVDIMSPHQNNSREKIKRVFI